MADVVSVLFFQVATVKPLHFLQSCHIHMFVGEGGGEGEYSRLIKYFSKRPQPPLFRLGVVLGDYKTVASFSHNCVGWHPDFCGSSLNNV